MHPAQVQITGLPTQPCNVYPASRVFSLTWFLRLRSHACRIVGLLTPCETTQQRSHANNSVNAKSHAREKPLLAGHVMVELEMVIRILFALGCKNKAYIQTVQLTYSFYKRSVASNKSHF